MAILRRYRIPYLLATNSQRRYAVKCLTLAGIAKDFPQIVSRDDVTEGKPAPDIYLQACSKLAIPPPLCLGVEDSHPGILAAYRAGTKPILIPAKTPTNSRIESLAVARFASLEQLAECIKEEAVQPLGSV